MRSALLEEVSRQGKVPRSSGMQGSDASAATPAQGLLRCIRGQALYIYPNHRSVARSDRGPGVRFMLAEELFVPVARRLVEGARSASAVGPGKGNLG